MILVALAIILAATTLVIVGRPRDSEVDFLRHRLVHAEAERAALLERLDALRAPVSVPLSLVPQPPEAEPVQSLSEQGEIDAHEELRRQRLLDQNT